MTKEQVKVKLNNQEFYVKPSDLEFVIDGEEKTLGTMLQEQADSKKQLNALQKKIEEYIKVEATAQQLIANAHDAMAIKIADLEADVKALKAGGK